MPNVTVISDGTFRCHQCILERPHEPARWNYATINMSMGEFGELHYCREHADEALDRLLADIRVVTQ